MTWNWRKAAGTTWRAVRSNKYCWIGAGLGIVSILAFSWVHFPNAFRPIGIPRASPELMKLLTKDTFWGFADLAVMPAALLFLAGMIMAFVSYLGGIVQTIGFAGILATDITSRTGPPGHLELGFYLAFASVIIVLMGWGLRLKNRQVRAYHSRLAAMSPRLGLFAR